MKNLLSYLFLGLLVCDVQAQPPQTNYRHFDMRHGLAQMKVHSLHEDRMGNIWVGTRNGLSKFNGETFTNFTTRDGLIGNRIMEITEDYKGNLIFITENGISVFDGVDFDNISANFTDQQDAKLLFNNNRRTIFARHDFIYTFDHDQHTIISEQIQHPYGAVPDSSTKGYRHIYKDIFNPNWHINTRPQTLYSVRNVDAKEWSLKYRIPAYDSTYSVISEWNNIQDDDYSASISSGAALKIEDSKVIGLSKEGYRWSLSTPSRITMAVESKNGQIVVGTESGIYVIPHPIFYHFDQDKPGYTWAVIEMDNRCFVCHSFSHGLYLIDSLFNVKPLLIPGSDEYPDYFRNHFSVRSAKDHNGTVYLPHFGILKISGALEPDDDLIDYIPSDRDPVFSIYFDTIRDQIVGSKKDGIAILEDELIRDVDLTGIGIDTGQSYESISQDIYNRYWLTSYSGLGVYSPESEEAIDYGDEYDPVVNEGAFGMHQDDTLLWLGLNEGLAKINVESMAFEKIESEVLTAMVKDIIDYNDSLLLIGAKDGLYLFNKNRFLNYREADIWPIGKSHGYTGVEPGFDCFYRDSKNRIWITSASHLSILKDNDDILQRAPLYPNFVSLNNERIHFHHVDSIYRIKSGINDVEIVYEACGLVRPDQVLYKYQVDDKDISDWISDSKVFLDDLSHGDHHIKLWVGPTDLSLEYLPYDILRFQVYLPLYKRSWFQWTVATLISAILIFYTIHFLITRRKQKRYLQNLKENQYLKNQILLSELNPHFIFNALSSIQSDVLKDDKIKASNQIVRLSKLIRAFLNSNYRGNLSHERNVTVPLSEELQLIKYYLTFEKEKHKDLFDYIISAPSESALQNLYIPPMLIQPLVENAIKHGIVPLKGRKGEIRVIVTHEENRLNIVVQDNGIGYEAAEMRNKAKIGRPASLGTKIIADRIAILSQLGYNIEVKKSSSDMGSRIEITINHD